MRGGVGVCMSELLGLCSINGKRQGWSLLLAYYFEFFRQTSYVNMWVMGMTSQSGEPVST